VKNKMNLAEKAVETTDIEIEEKSIRENGLVDIKTQEKAKRHELTENLSDHEKTLVKVTMIDTKKFVLRDRGVDEREEEIDYSKPENMTRKQRKKHHDKQQAAYEAEVNQ